VNEELAMYLDEVTKVVGRPLVRWEVIFATDMYNYGIGTEMTAKDILNEQKRAR
jgi:hypothetical protein